MTTRDNQDLVTISVHQGESERATDNRMLGMFNMTGIPPGKAGTVRIDVSFEIDTDGVLHVSAVDTKTGRNQAIQITGHSGLSPEELERAQGRVANS